ncbi:MAG: hypothetical protein WA865_08145 [Spirulinaceae cyanobacterium]
MNPSGNGFQQANQPSGEPSPVPSDSSESTKITETKTQITETKTPTTETNTSGKPDESASDDTTKLNSAPPSRQHPIPPPSEPRQYRAIGLVRGKYQPSEEQLTRGNLFTSEENPLDSVLLGRVISLVKNHLSLEESHLWVVYPRTRQNEGDLHVQIVGVWEPETLSQAETDDADDVDSTKETKVEETTSEDDVKDGFFSIRGEVIYYSQEEEKVIVKIQQAPRRESESTKFFKLELSGDLHSDRAVGHFWDFEVQLQGNKLAIQEATDVGVMPIKKRKGKKGSGNNRRRPQKGRKSFSGNRPRPKKDKPSSSTGKPIPKPTKRQEK